MTDEMPGTKPKELSQAHARGHARELIESVGGGGQWDAALKRFEALSAGNRRTVLEALHVDTKGAPVKGEPSRVFQLGLSSLKAGKATKPDFVVGMVQTVLETCPRFDTGGRNVAGELLHALLSSSERRDGKGLIDISQLDLSRLGKSEAVGMALSSLLGDPGNDEVIRATIQVWGRLLCAQLASRGVSCGIAPESARKVLLIMADASALLPPELVLSVSWLGQIAGGVPQALLARFPISVSLGAEGGSHGPAKNRTESAIALKSPRDALLEAIDEAVSAFEEEGEQRRATLSAALARASEDLGASRAELAQEQVQTRSLNHKVEELTRTLQQQTVKLAKAAQDLGTLREEIDKWRKEANILLESRAHQVRDAKVETRKEFVSSARTHLISLRGFLLELKQRNKSDTVSLSATAFDQVIRILQRQGFLTAEELPRLNERETGSAK